MDEERREKETDNSEDPKTEHRYRIKRYNKGTWHLIKSIV